MDDQPIPSSEGRGTSGRDERSHRAVRSAISRRSFLATGITTAAVAGAGCIDIIGGSSSEEVTYRHRFDRSGIGSAGYDAGVELGIWEEEGLSVDFDISSGSEAAAQSVASGADEFANAEVAAVLKLIDEGAPLTIIAQETTPLGGIISLDDTGIETWDDLTGQVVGRFPWGVTGSLGAAAMQQEGVDSTAVEWRNVNPGAHIVLLLEGEIDAAVAYYPQAVARLNHMGHETTVFPLSSVLDHLGNTVVTHDNLVTEDPEIVNQFIRGWLRAHRTFITDPDEVIDIHESIVAEFDEVVERKVLGSVLASRIAPEIDLVHGMGWTPEDRMENTLEVLAGIDLIDDELPEGTTFTNQFIEENQTLAIETAELYRDILTADYDVGPGDV